MVGQTILHYRVIEKLGAGGMGEIYKAEDTRLKRVVAIKVLSPRLASDPERRKRFFQEARAASALNHPNIITLYDIVSEDEMQCIVMEYVSGKTLRELTPPTGLGAPQALQYAIQMAGALAAAHAAGIIHRDLKPSNVMVTNAGLVKILDFGLAKWIDPTLSSQPGDQATVDQAITTEGSIVGTVSYMSPEQALGKRLDPRSDIFSFGCVMYEMITGRRAFEGSSGISTLSSILRDDVKPINESAVDVPPALDQIILRCLPKDPDARWQSIKEIEGRLTALHRQLDASGRFPVPMASGDLGVETQPTPVPSVVAPPPAPSPAPVKAKPVPAAKNQPAARPVANAGLVWGLIGAVLIASAAVGGWILWKGQAQQPAPQEAARTTVPEPSSAPRPSPLGAPLTEPPPAEKPPAIPPGSSTTPPANSTPNPALPPAPKPTDAKKAAPKSTVPPKVQPAPVPKASGGQDNAAPAPKTSVEPAPQTPKQPAQPPPVQAVPVSITDGLPFRIALAEEVPTDIEQGKALRFVVAESVRVNDHVVIAKGALVTGAVAREAGKKKFLGMGGGKGTFQLQQVEAVDGKKLNVRATAGRSSDNIAMRPFDTGKGSKPKGIAALEGTEYIGYIDGAQTVSVAK